MSGLAYWPEGIKRGEIAYWDGSAPARLGGGQSNYIPVWGPGGVPIWVPPASIAALMDHGLLLGLADDDHTQYALLAGRVGGQTLIGSPTAAQGLVLRGSGVMGTGTVTVGQGGIGIASLLVEEASNQVTARGWMRVGGVTAPTQALAVTGDIGGSNELQVPKGRFTDNNLVYNTLTVGQNSLVNLNTIDVMGGGVVNVNTGFRVGNAAAAGTVLRGNGTNYVPATLTVADVGLNVGWTTYAHNAADFTADLGTWTVDAGDVVGAAYFVVGKTMYLTYNFTTTSVSSTPSVLRWKIPGGFTAARTLDAVSTVLNNSATWAIGQLRATSASNLLTFFNTGGANWAVSVNNSGMRGQIVLELQ